MNEAFINVDLQNENKDRPEFSYFKANLLIRNKFTRKLELVEDMDPTYGSTLEKRLLLFRKRIEEHDINPDEVKIQWSSEAKKAYLNALEVAKKITGEAKETLKKTGDYEDLKTELGLLQSQQNKIEEKFGLEGWTWKDRIKKLKRKADKSVVEEYKKISNRIDDLTSYIGPLQKAKEATSELRKWSPSTIEKHKDWFIGKGMIFPDMERIEIERRRREKKISYKKYLKYIKDHERKLPVVAPVGVKIRRKTIVRPHLRKRRIVVRRHIRVMKKRVRRGRLPFKLSKKYYIDYSAPYWRTKKMKAYLRRK